MGLRFQFEGIQAILQLPPCFLLPPSLCLTHMLCLSLSHLAPTSPLLLDLFEILA